MNSKTRLGELMSTFPDLNDAFVLNDIDASGAHPESTLSQLCDALEIGFEDLLAVILEALGGELDPDDDHLDDFDAEDPDEHTDPLEGLNVPGYDDEEEEPDIHELFGDL